MSKINGATNEMAKRIAAMLKDIDRKPPVEQMATYLAIGEKLACMVERSSPAVADVVSLVPQLRTEWYGIMELFRRGDEIQEFMLKETATPMDNGKHLTLGHWLWLFHHQSQRSEVEQDAWLGRELAWLRKESPAAAVLEHVDAVLEDEHKREMDQLRESAREVIGMLEMI